MVPGASERSDWFEWLWKVEPSASVGSDSRFGYRHVAGFRAKQGWLPTFVVGWAGATDEVSHRRNPDSRRRDGRVSIRTRGGKPIRELSNCQRAARICGRIYPRGSAVDQLHE